MRRVTKDIRHGDGDAGFVGHGDCFKLFDKLKITPGGYVSILNI